jgi:hypothetical protein
MGHCAALLFSTVTSGGISITGIEAGRVHTAGAWLESSPAGIESPDQERQAASMAIVEEM